MKISAKQSAALVFTITFLLFCRALFCDFVNLDDPQYVYLNPAIKVLDLRFIIEAFTASYMGWWMPLTWISFAVDYYFWGLNPVGYHLTNILLHAGNAGLTALVADRVLKLFSSVHVGNSLPMTTSAECSTRDAFQSRLFLVPLLAGLLWGIHPLRVESVAWVTERKDVLSGMFSILAILSYLRYISRACIGGNRLASSDYLFTVGFFLLAMLSKPVSVVLPVMFLVLDWYPLGRLRQGRINVVLVEKIPLMLLSAVVAGATIYFAAGETILVSLADYPLYKRLLVAGYALTDYVRLSIYPLGLAHLYLLPMTFTPVHYIFTTIAVLFTGVCIGLVKRYPWLLATWLLFLVPLLPVLGFFQNGSQSHADRFTYLPALFPAIAAAVILLAASARLQNCTYIYGRICTLMVLALLLAYSAVTFCRIGDWQNSATLWSRLLAIQPVGRAYYYRGEYYLQSGRYPEAILDLESAIRFAREAGVPEIYNLHALLGDALSRSGRFDAAVKELTIAIEMNPLPNYFYHRALALSRLGRTVEAEADFKAAGSATGPILWEWSKR